MIMFENYKYKILYMKILRCKLDKLIVQEVFRG